MISYKLGITPRAKAAQEKAPATRYYGTAVTEFFASVIQVHNKNQHLVCMQMQSVALSLTMRYLLLLLICLPILTLALISNPTTVRLPFQASNDITNMLLLHNGSVLIAGYDSSTSTTSGHIFSIDAVRPRCWCFRISHLASAARSLLPLQILL